MKRVSLLIGFLLALAVVFAACSREAAEKKAEEDWLSKDYPAIQGAAQGTTVRFAMYGGFEQANRWIDTWAAPELKRRYGITLERVPLDAAVFVNKLLAEKGAKTDPGTLDLLWINGENFRSAKRAGVLFGPYADKLPNYQAYADHDLAAHDFGFPTEGFETPYGWAQFVFEYDSARIKNPPDTFAKLLDWVRQHPGRFTYPQPPDFTGSAFIRQAFYAVTGGHKQYAGDFNEGLYRMRAPMLWSYLNEMKPYLWEKGRNYPKDSAALDTLFARGEVDMGMSYHPLHAQSKVLEGTYKDTVRTFVMNDGSLFNLHFTAIPFNAPNKPGAMVVADFLMSPEAQSSKFDPRNWGDFPAVDVSRLPEDMQKKIVGMKLGKPTLSFSVLGVTAVPEIASDYVEALEKGWDENVLRK